MSDITWQALVVLALVGVIIEGVILAGTLRELGTLTMQIGPPRSGEVDGPLKGTVAEVDSLEDRPAVLVFVSPQCSLCPPVAKALPIASKSFPEVQVLAAVVKGSDSERNDYASHIEVETRINLSDLLDRWNIPGTPYGVGLDRNHRVVASGIVNNLPQLEAMTESVINIGEYTQVEAVPEVIELEGSLQGGHDGR